MMSISCSSDSPTDASPSSDAGRSTQPTQQGLPQVATTSAASPAPAPLLDSKTGSMARLASGRSFLAHRRQLNPRTSADPRRTHTAGGSRGPSQSFRTSTSSSQHTHPRLRQAGDRGPPPTPAAPPPLLELSASGPRPSWTHGGNTSEKEPPCSAPISRLARTAARRGISIDVALSKVQAQKQTAPAASAGLPTRFHALSTPPNTNLLSVPTFAAPRYSASTGSLTPMPSPTFRRGLTVAIMTGDGEIVAESAPVTPRGFPDDIEVSIPQLTNGHDRKSLVPSDMGATAARQREIILCRYYHTEGLTCTSSPCRFVHSLEGLLLRGSSLTPATSNRSLPVHHLPQVEKRTPSMPSSRLRLVSHSGRLSATPAVTVSSPDPTHGTFARAQDATPLAELQLDTDALATIQSGDPVSLQDAEGKEITGHVFKLSGGGKGAGGKSRTKYKTVPCRDYAESHCAYGDYCSFIHDPANLYDPLKHGKKEPKADSAPSDTFKHTMSERPSSDSSTPSDTILTPSTDVPPVLSEVSLKNVQSNSQPGATSSAGVKTPSIVTGSPAEFDQQAGPGPDAPSVSSAAPHATYEVPFDAAGNVAQGPVYAMAPAEYGNGVTWVEWNPAWGPAQQWPTQQVLHTPWQVSVSPIGMAMSPVSPLPPAAQESSVVWTPDGFQIPDTNARTRGFWRTQPCRLFTQGICRHGDNCSFLHTTAPMRPRRLNSGSKSSPVRTTPCKWFNSTSGCEAGEACTFQHVQVIPPEHQSAVPRPWRTKPCRHFQVGKCRMGDSCHYAHVKADIPPSSASSSHRTASHDSQGPSSPLVSRGSEASTQSPSSPARRQAHKWNGGQAESPVHPSSFSATSDTPVYATEEVKDPDSSTSTHSDPTTAIPHTPVSPLNQRRASAPPTLPEAPTITIPPASGTLHSSSDTPAAKEICADWLASGKCQREDCRFAHCPTTPLTEEHLSKACAELRLLKRYDDLDSESEGEEDDVEFVTVATHSSASVGARSPHSPTTMSTSSL